MATWDDPARTLKAIASEGYKWPQIIDAGMTPMDAYGFDGIPMIMHFAPDGTMVAREIMGEGIWKAVENDLNFVVVPRYCGSLFIDVHLKHDRNILITSSCVDGMEF